MCDVIRMYIRYMTNFVYMWSHYNNYQDYAGL
jgi:hypothetical protein